MISLDVVGLVRDVTHGMSDTTSKLTGTVSHVLGQATGDSSFQVEREQNLESCQSSGDHFKAGLINLTGGIFGGMSSIITQPYKGAVEEGIGVSNFLPSSLSSLSSSSPPLPSPPPPPPPLLILLIPLLITLIISELISLLITYKRVQHLVIKAILYSSLALDLDLLIPKPLNPKSSFLNHRVSYGELVKV